LGRVVVGHEVGWEAQQTGGTQKKTEATMQTEFFQSEGGKFTIAVIHDPDGFSAVGIARAGRIDEELGNVNEERGREIALGRAKKVRVTKEPLVEKNYLRGLYGKRVVENGGF